jgi:hypothetical protein
MSVGRITPVKRRAVREADGRIRLLDDDEEPGDFKGSFTEPPRKAPNAFKNPGHHLEDRVQKILRWEGFQSVEVNRLVRDSDGPSILSMPTALQRLPPPLSILTFLHIFTPSIGHLSEIDVVAHGGRIFSRWFPRLHSPLKIGQGAAFVECKRYNQANPVSLADAAKFKEVGVMNGLRRRNMLIVTTSSFVPRARKIGISTVDGPALIKWERAAWRRFRQRRVRHAILAGAFAVAGATVAYGAACAREYRRGRFDSAPPRDASLFSRKLWEMVGGVAPAPRRSFLVGSSAAASFGSASGGVAPAAAAGAGETGGFVGTLGRLGVVVTLHDSPAAEQRRAQTGGGSAPAADAPARPLVEVLRENPFESMWGLPARVAADSELGKRVQAAMDRSHAAEEQRKRRRAADTAGVTGIEIVDTAAETAAELAINAATKAVDAGATAAHWVAQPVGGFRSWFWQRNDAIEFVWMPPGCEIKPPHPTAGVHCPAWIAEDENKTKRPVRLFRLPIPHVFSMPNLEASSSTKKR